MPNRLVIGVGCAVMAMFLGIVAAAGDVDEHAALGVTFHTPVPFADAESIGMDAVALAHPPDVEFAEVTCEIVLCRMSAVMRERMGGDAATMLAYAKSTFLGTAKPAEGTSERTFLGSVSTGEILTTKMPRPARLETHLLPLSDGASLVVSVRTFDAAPEGLADQVMATLAESLTEQAASPEP